MELLELTRENTQINPALSAHLCDRIERDFIKRWNGPWGGRSLVHGRDPGPNSVRLNGNDYLNLTGRPEIVQAQSEALRSDTEFVIQSGSFLLETHPVRAFEKKMANWIGKDDGVLCQSGYAANMGLLQCIADAQTPVYMDMLAHTSLWEGARRAEAPVHPFRHNDVDHLRRLIAKHGGGLVVVDSVYSTTGAMAPLVDLVDVAEAGGCMILVDESHSLGTHGPGGAGLCVALGLSHRVHFVTASLAKAFAGRAGFFNIPTGLRNYILSTSHHNIFSSCLLPHEVAGLSTTLDVVQGCDVERERLHRISRQMRESFSELGYPVHQGTEQIIALEGGTEPDTLVLRDHLESRDVFGAVFCAPATARNRTMVRLTLSSALTDAELDHVAHVAREIAPLVKPWEWPLARRARSARVQIPAQVQAS
ncbi:alpha-hydroxyketone-type quorum-sensing autoinducer synthase [Hydrogenophaga sp. PAMC20947]|uniref:alpha-hydroxyketone-type quorum-sensing autoinducer synthase n=1 Tax=Hydrogenophaga sp. PAMC20947 TaxID=2565558 RepID=UPI00109DD130|nr:alpha-hydroxyketone-type quorum-sensing autoinducer synthase [Hydrogenophaga sp. PAMC20947]QCB48091.1 quorum-sensing autoinducer synthase [Hydrogenophaga sp. PAMC20947]